MTRLLIDTHLLLWLARGESRLPASAAAMIEERTHPVAFSVVSIWEIAIKSGLGRPGFRVDPRRMRDAMLTLDFEEVQVTADHAVGVGSLPWLHRDPFDRLLIAQAQVERMTLLTADRVLARYPGPIRLVT